MGFLSIFPYFPVLHWARSWTLRVVSFHISIFSIRIPASLHRFHKCLLSAGLFPYMHKCIVSGGLHKMYHMYLPFLGVTSTRAGVCRGVRVYIGLCVCVQLYQSETRRTSSCIGSFQRLVLWTTRGLVNFGVPERSIKYVEAVVKAMSPLLGTPPRFLSRLFAGSWGLLRGFSSVYLALRVSFVVSLMPIWWLRHGWLPHVLHKHARYGCLQGCCIAWRREFRGFLVAF